MAIKKKGNNREDDGEDNINEWVVCFDAKNLGFIA